MSTDEAYIKLAERSGHADSERLHLILEKAMNPEEARFLLQLPASNADLAAKFQMTEKAVEEKVYGLARRGLVVTSRKGIRFPRDLGTLHDNILASVPDAIPEGIGQLWMDFYESGWWKEIVGGLTQLPTPALRVILPLKAVPAGGAVGSWRGVQASHVHLHPVRAQGGIRPVPRKRQEGLG